MVFANSIFKVACKQWIPAIVIELGWRIQKVYMEDLSFCDKIRLFKSSKFILGIHGAGMSYSVFCDPSVKIIEIRDAAPSYKHYHEICERLAFSYTQFTDVIEDETKKHLKINVPVFEAFLERYFA